MQYLPIIVAILAVLASFIFVPFTISTALSLVGLNKALLVIGYISVVIAFLACMSMKNRFEMGSFFTYFFILLSLIFVTQVFAGVLSYLYLLIKLVIKDFAYPMKSIFALSGALVLFAYYSGTQLTVREVSFKFDNLENNLTIVHLPDIHLGHYQNADYLKKVIAKSNSYSPDIVLLNGDLFEENYRLQPYVKEILATFKGEVIFTQGNHELYVNYNDIKGLINELDFVHLENELYISHGIQIVGTDYLDADENFAGGHPSPNDVYLRDYLAELELDANIPSILVHHTPVGAKYVAQKGFDIMLAGHTHGGGQVWPATILGSKSFDYSKGLHTLDNLKIYVSEGVGKFGVPLRLGTKNEINVIRLEA